MSAAKARALAAVAQIVAEEGAILDTLTPDEVAARAWHPGGPTREVIAERFREYRALRAA